MKRKQNAMTRAGLALLLSSSMTMNALASSVGVVDVETTAGNNEAVEVTITIEKTENSNGSTTVHTSSNAEGYETESGMKVDYSSESTMTTNKSGVTTGNSNSSYTAVNSDGTYSAAGGSETTITTNPNVNQTVDVPLTSDNPETEEIENQNTVLGTEVGTVLETEGEKPKQPSEGEYNYSETVVKEQGSVTITNTKTEFTEKIDIENTNMQYTVSTTTPTDDNDLVYPDVYNNGNFGPGINGVAPEMYQPGYDGEVDAPEGSDEDNYGYTYVGSGNTSMFMPAIVYTEPLDEDGKLAMFGENAYIKNNSITWYYEKWLTPDVKASIAKDENGNYVTDENGYILDVEGNRIFKEERTSVDPDGNTVYLHRFDNFNGTMYAEGWYENGKWVEELNGEKSFAAIWAGPQQFILVDDKGNTVTAYCADVSTPTQDNYGYNVENLEDADYYSDEEAKQIRAIAKNGYWGDNGNLEEMRASLLKAGFKEEELASLTDGVALTATQMAIWSCSNKMSSIQFINSYYSDWGLGNVPEDKEEEVKLLFKLYDYLMELEPIEVEGTTADTVITKDKFVDGVSVTVIEKVVDHENNQDDDDSNDTYKTNVSFALVVKPSTENGDDLIVQVVSDGIVLATGRIAGTPKEGENYQQLTDVDGNYTFEGIEMTEGNQNLKLTLHGIQNLKEGVYLYSSEVKDEVSSQTLVGVASGDRSVNVEMNIEFELDVNDELVVTEHVWREEETKPTEPQNPPTEPQDPPTEPQDPPTEPQDPPTEPDRPEKPDRYERIDDDDVPLASVPVVAIEEDPVPLSDVAVLGAFEIEDDMVPLAVLPATGDHSLLWMFMSFLSGLSLAGASLVDKMKKRKK